MSPTARHLRLQADQCRRLARSVNGTRDVVLLESLAKEYEARAAALEAEAEIRQAG